MAIKASAQETIIDITDAYAVYLTCASYTFPGTTTGAKAGSCATSVIAMRGADQVETSVDASAVTKPSGVSVSATKQDDGSTALSISVTTSVTTPGKVTIPVTVDGAAEFTLEFSFGIALTGKTGAAGADALVMVITSSNGTIFKNASINTTLTAHVYKGGVELTSVQIATLGSVRWYKDGSTTAAATGLTFNISASTVNVKTNIVAQLEG